MKYVLVFVKPSCCSSWLIDRISFSKVSGTLEKAKWTPRYLDDPCAPRRLERMFASIRARWGRHFKSDEGESPYGQKRISASLKEDFCSKLRNPLQIDPIQCFQNHSPDHYGGDMERMQYLDMRRIYHPGSLNLLIIAESPPASGLYFYDPNGRVTEPIFAEFMKYLGLHPSTKADGLQALRDIGWLLLDATYEPIDKKFRSRDRRRDAILLRDYSQLKEDIQALSTGRSVPIVLMKENVCRVLEPVLLADKFNVLNRGRKVYLPVQGNQSHFHRQLREILTRAFHGTERTCRPF